MRGEQIPARTGLSLCRLGAEGKVGWGLEVGCLTKHGDSELGELVPVDVFELLLLHTENIGPSVAGLDVLDVQGAVFRALKGRNWPWASSETFRDGSLVAMGEPKR